MKGNKKFFISGGSIYDPLTKEKSKKNIVVDNGTILDITSKDTIPSGYEVVDSENMIVTTGFIDIRSHFKDPGDSYEETLFSGSRSAISGGYTKVCIVPDTCPIIDNAEIVEYINNINNDLPIDMYVIGAATKRMEGKEISEIGLMCDSGIVGVSDYEKPIENSQLFRMIMEYSKKFNIPVINHPEDLLLSNLGIINEGKVSTFNGLTGIPDIAESSMLFRDISIAEYVSGRIHVPHISSEKSVKLIREAKNKGISVTCEVTPHHLYFSENNFSNYNSNWKVLPPIRLESDRIALIEGLIDGSIDCIASDHSPHKNEEKEKDIFHAEFGSIGLESSFGAINKSMKEHGVDIYRIIEWLTIGPSRVMNIPIEPIAPKSKANLVVLDENKEWTYNLDSNRSKSNNSIFINQKLIGKVAYVLSCSELFSN